MVSIIIPCFNAAELLAETLDNVLLQTYTDIECIIIDDGSTDNTKSVVEKYMANDSRIKYHYQENQERSVARNNGIQKAKGEYIQFLDADDLILGYSPFLRPPQKISRNPN